MSSPLTDPAANQALDNQLQATYLCLFTDDPGQSGAFPNEVAAADYARVPVEWSPAAARTKENLAVAMAPATSTWGLIKYAGAASSPIVGQGTLKAVFLLDAPVLVVRDIQFTAGDGDLSLSVPA